MPTVSRTVTTAAPLTVVRDYLRDFSNAPEWDAGTKTCDQISDGPVGVGTQWRNVSVFRGRETTLTYTLEVDDAEHIRIVGRNKTVTSQDDIRMADLGESTQVTYTATFTFHGVAKVVTPFMVPALGGLADDAEKSLGDALQTLPAR